MKRVFAHTPHFFLKNAYNCVPVGYVFVATLRTLFHASKTSFKACVAELLHQINVFQTSGVIQAVTGHKINLVGCDGHLSVRKENKIQNIGLYHVFYMRVTLMLVCDVS